MEEKEKKKDSLHLKLIPYFDKYGILLLLVLMIVVMQILQPDVFLSWRNVTNVFKQISWQSMLALGVFMVIVTAGIDLSVGSILMLSLMILAIVSKAGAPWFVVVLAPMFAGLLCGLINGLGITLLRMPHPFIMTLGTLYIFRGAGNLISGGSPISGFTDEVRYQFRELDHYPVLFISSTTRQRINKVLEISWSVYERTKNTIPTNKLNTVIEKTIRETPPPAEKGKVIKVNYSVQVHKQPVVIALYSNYPKLIKVPYQRFLMNQIRAGFDLQGIPIRLSLRKK